MTQDGAINLSDSFMPASLAGARHRPGIVCSAWRPRQDVGVQPFEYRRVIAGPLPVRIGNAVSQVLPDLALLCSAYP
jgi:hypothetical protein